MSGRYQIIGADDDEEETPVARPANQPAPAQPGPPSGGYGGQQAAMGGAGEQFVTVVVPENWAPGQHLMIPTPNGNQVVSVPPGLAPGQQFRVPVPPVGQQLLNVQVPPGVGPGQQLTVRAPNGQLFMATVPPAHGPGSTFQMAIPRGSGAPPPPPQGGGGMPPMQQQQQQQAPPPPAPRSQAEMATSAQDQAVQMRETAVLLESCLSGLEPGENVQANELVQELVTQCQAQSTSGQRLLSEVTDEAAMMAMLEANDAVQSALTKYESVLVKTPGQQHQATPVSGGSQGSTPAWLDPSLGGGDFPGAPPAAPAAAHLLPPPPSGKPRAEPTPAAPAPPEPQADLLYTGPMASQAQTQEAELQDMFGGGPGMAQPAFAGIPSMGMPSMGAPMPPPAAFPTMGEPAPNPLAGAMLADTKTAAPPDSNLLSEADDMLGGPPAMLMDHTTVITPNIAAVQTKEAVLDDEANNLLAEFDDLIGSMETPRLPAQGAAAPSAGLTDK